jgi:hypothetical protein
LKYSLYKATYRVIKILLTVLIIFSFSPKITLSSENISCKQDKENHIENITVKIYKDRNWTKNNIKILISNTRTIPKDLRKRFKGEIKVQYTNGSLCVLKAKIRQNGDLKDHFIYENNNVKQSLDVELTNGNLGGITKFKLLLDGTRGDSKDEIFLTELLRELGFISPRTQFVEAYVNNVKSTMLLQEKSTKEMFEYNDRIESAIFESNENDFFKSLESFSNNNLTNDEIGLNAILDKATMGQFARLINGKWALKSPIHLEISLRALSNLNSVYINSLNNFKQYPNKSVHNDNFDNSLLGKQNKKNIIKVDQYKLILKAANADHALKATNRKFYWNKLENYFEPIYYDGNTVIYINENIEIDLPSSPYINTALDELSDTLLKLDLKTFKEKLINRKLNLTDLEVQKKIKIINFNLSKLRTNINKNDSISNQSYEKLKKDSKIIQTAILNKKDNNSNTLFVFKEIGQEFNNSFLVCTTYNSCKKREFTKKEQSKILTGNFFENKREYIYIGYYSNLEIKSEVIKFNFINFKDSKINFYYNDGIKFDFDIEKNEFNIFQLKPEARAYFINSNIKNLDIKFNGLENFENLFYLPFDLKGLTGCLTFFNSNFKNVNLKSFNSNCEDSINMVNVKGEIKNVNIKNSYSDALDIDFSHVNIENIDITGSRNDCVDVSFGKYDFTFLNLDKCGDKGLSVGEKSEIIINKVAIDNSKLGIASKDGSSVNIFHANIKNVNTCLASYNKKPEFSGGYIKIDKFICDNYVNENVIDDHSKILLLK